MLGDLWPAKGFLYKFLTHARISEILNLFEEQTDESGFMIMSLTNMIQYCVSDSNNQHEHISDPKKTSSHLRV